MTPYFRKHVLDYLRELYVERDDTVRDLEAAQNRFGNVKRHLAMVDEEIRKHCEEFDVRRGDWDLVEYKESLIGTEIAG